MTGSQIRYSDTGSSKSGVLRFAILERDWSLPELAQTTELPQVREQILHAGLQRLAVGLRPRRKPEQGRHRHATRACHLDVSDHRLSVRADPAAHTAHRRRHPRLRQQRRQRRPPVEGGGTVRAGLHQAHPREEEIT